MATPHISAADGDFAETVLLPGDPLRAKFLADNYLDQANLVTSVRGMLGYTGLYQGVPVSVMGSGMGMPSAAIYCYELFKFYNVANIIRIGSCGAVASSLQIHDVVAAIGCCTDSQINRNLFGNYDFAATCDFHLLATAVECASALDLNLNVGRVFSSDLFYLQREMLPTYQLMNVIAVEMESAGIYGVAAQLGKRALALLTVSDNVVGGEELSSTERQSGFDSMMRLALNTASRWAQQN